MRSDVERRVGTTLLLAMLRRVPSTLPLTSHHGTSAVAICGTSVRSITCYEFGHPAMETEFLPQSHYATKKLAVDQGVRVSRLPNRIRVITHDIQGAHVAVGTYFGGGAKYDPVGFPGLSNVLRWGLIGSNLENSKFQRDRLMRAFGASVGHTEIAKRLIGLKVEAAAGSWERVVQDVWTTLAAPRLAESDLTQYRDHMDAVVSELRWQQPREYAIDQLECVAFYREPLGNPRLVQPVFNDKITAEELLRQWARLVFPANMIVAGVNVEHDTLIALYENASFQHTGDALHHRDAATDVAKLLGRHNERDQFYPGNEAIEHESRVKAMGTKPYGGEEAIFALGYRAPGSDDNTKQYATSLVIREIAAMQFGESLPLNRTGSHHGTESFYRPFASTGLIGATTRTSPSDAAAAIVEAAKALKTLPLDADTLKVAARRAIGRLTIESFEFSRDYCDFLAMSLVDDGLQHRSSDDLIAAILAVDTAAAKAVLDEAFAQQPALFGTGLVIGVPSLRKLQLP